MSKQFSELIRNKRTKTFDNAYDFIYQLFEELGYNKKNTQYFLENTSTIVENLRSLSWKKYVPLEKKFTSNLLKSLVDIEKIEHKKGIEAVTWFIETFPEEIYQLTLSNTQSRRSRAGKEFESIIELILIGAEIPMDSQGSIGKKVFVDKGLGKLVDIVSPGTVEYNINKRNTVLISAKTTLRERWQEVPEEMGRTGAREMFLATLDNSVTNDVIHALNEANIQMVTTQKIKKDYYSSNANVLDFEELLKILKENQEKWTDTIYSADDLIAIKTLLEKQKNKHKAHTFVEEYYANLIKRIE